MEAPPSPLSSRPEESWAFGPPKAMKNGSCSATTVAGSAVLPFVISTGGVMGLRPTQGDEKRVLFSNYCCWKRRPPLCHLDRRSHGPSAHPRRWRTGPVQQPHSMEAPPSPLSSRPEESWAFGPPKAMKSGSCSATTVAGSAALPFVISTEAQRSGEICGVSGPSLGNVFQQGEAQLRDPRLLPRDLRLCGLRLLANQARCGWFRCGRLLGRLLLLTRGKNRMQSGAFHAGHKLD